MSSQIPRVELVNKSSFIVILEGEMKGRRTKSDASESKGKVKKRIGETSAPTQSKRLREKKDGETSEQAGPPLKSAGVQKSGCGSILHYIYKSTLGQSLHSQMRQCLQEPFIRSLSSYHFHSATSPFDRRITCLEWHPTHPTTLAVGSKGGDLYLWDFKVPAKKTFIQGVRSCVMLCVICFSSCWNGHWYEE